MAYTQPGPSTGSDRRSYEWAIDVTAYPISEESDFIQIPDITALDPGRAAVTAEGGTYANLGQTSTTKISTNFNPTLQIKPVTADDGSGLVQAGLELLIAAADASGDEAKIGVRLYSTKILNVAYEGTVIVDWNRQNTDNASTEFFAFTLSGQGDFVKIDNPAFES